MKERVLKNSHKAYDIAGLEEIIFIQDVTLRFMRKLALWKISPEGLTKNIQQRIRPYLNEIFTQFNQELARERVAEKRRFNAEITASQAIQEAPPSNVQRERKAARYEEVQRRILRSVEEENVRWDRFVRLKNEGLPPSFSLPPPMKHADVESDAWTEEEDNALIDELLNNRGTRELPGTTDPYRHLRLGRMANIIQRKSDIWQS